MTTRPHCPPEPDLLPLALSEPADPAVRGHVENCHACRRRVEALRAQTRALHELAVDLQEEIVTLVPAATMVGRPGDVSATVTAMPAPAAPAAAAGLPAAFGPYRRDD